MVADKQRRFAETFRVHEKLMRRQRDNVCHQRASHCRRGHAVIHIHFGLTDMERLSHVLSLARQGAKRCKHKDRTDCQHCFHKRLIYGATVIVWLCVPLTTVIVTWLGAGTGGGATDKTGSGGSGPIPGALFTGSLFIGGTRSAR